MQIPIEKYPAYLVVSATVMEISPLLSRSTVLSESMTPSGARTIKARIGNTDFHSVVTGPGVINTAHGLTVYLERYACHQKGSDEDRDNNPLLDIKKSNLNNLLIIQTGIAGFFKDSGLEMGDIAVATSETYIHTGVNREISSCSSSCSSYPHDPLPFDLLPNRPMSRQGHFEFDSNMIRKSCATIEKGLTDFFFSASSRRWTNQNQSNPFCLMTGNFITVSAITSTTEHADLLYNAFNCPCMESMEGAASAHIAALYNLPFIEIRAGSNPVGIRDKKKWDIPLACLNASFALEALLEKGELS
ncbi:MAG: hypothetical protein HQK61_00315 [Desulfamplus sp.]|nr:hypothetical protein [Desulfamplus sp.]